MNPSDRHRMILADREVQRPLKQAAENFVSLLTGQENPPTGYLLAFDSSLIDALEEALLSADIPALDDWLAEADPEVGEPVKSVEY